MQRWMTAVRLLALLAVHNDEGRVGISVDPLNRRVEAQEGVRVLGEDERIRRQAEHAEAELGRAVDNGRVVFVKLLVIDLCSKLQKCPSGSTTSS